MQDFSADPELLHRIVHPEDAQAWHEHVQQVALDRGYSRITFRIVNRTGREVWIEHRCVAEVDEEGRNRGRRASNRDVTRRVGAEQELRRENERLRREIELLRQVQG